MSVASKGPDGRDGAMAHLGKKTAAALLVQDPGDPNEQTGWRGALQDAADVSRHQPDVLQVADDLYRDGHTMTSPIAIHRYVTTTVQTILDGPGHWLLRGMLEHVQTTRARATEHPQNEPTP